MKKTAYCWLTATLLLTATVGRAQQIGGTTADPNLSAKSQGGGMSSIYSPSLYDGTVNVTIPIYQYSAEGGDYGVSFTYNTKGVLVDETSGEIGLHWLLRTGPKIERTVKGLPDELSLPTDSVYVNSTTYYLAFKGRLATAYESSSQAQDQTVYRDGESDDFQVSLGGRSFTFNIGKTGAIWVNPQQNVTVQLLYNGVPLDQLMDPQNPQLPSPLNLEFLITDPEGNRFYFTKGDYQTGKGFYMDVDPVQNLIGEYALIKDWVIKKVTLANGNEINYTYQHDFFSMYYRESSYNFAQRENVGINPTGGYRGSYQHQNLNRCRISQIDYPNASRVEFVYETDAAKKRCDGGDYALREIKVAAGGNCLRYRLNQSYSVALYGANTSVTSLAYGNPCVTINANPTNPDIHPLVNGNGAHRLRLDGISLLSCDGTVTEPFYSFSYDATALPVRFSASQDFFGYFNYGIPVRPSSDMDEELAIPYHQAIDISYTYQYGVSKNSDFSKMPAGVLTGITNAYGGSVAFAYEPNSGCDASLLSSILPTDAYFIGEDAADGLRIASITETDPYHPGDGRRTSFGYSGGQLFITGGYFHYPYWLNEYQNGPTQGGSFGRSFVTPHPFVNGSNHGYSTVTVTSRNLANQQLSRKVVQFSNFKDGSNPAKYQVPGGAHFFQFPFSNKQYLREWEMGLPLSITEYDDQDLVLQQTTNNYSFSTDASSSMTAGVDNVKQSYVAGGGIFQIGQSYSMYPLQQPVTDAYHPYRGKALLAATEVKKYTSDNTYISDAVSYTYDSHDNLKTIVTHNSKGEEIQTIQYYNYDMAFNDGNGGVFVPLSGLEKLVGTQRWKRLPGNTAALPGGGQLLDAYFTGFAAQGTTGNFSKIWNKALYNLRSGIPQTYSQYLGSGPSNTTDKKVQAAFNGSDLEGFRKTSQVQRFDAKGNPLETQLLGLDEYKAMIWDTATGQKLAEAANCRYQDIAYSSFENNHAQSGNLSYNALAATRVAGGISGAYFLRLYALGSNLNLDGSQSLSQGRAYVLSFWVKGTAPTVSQGGLALTLPAASVTQGSWRQYILRFTAQVNGTLRISGTGAQTDIDEVRLHPATAVMTSQTYTPLFGVSSSTDATGRISYVAYDKLGRQILVRNQEGQILSKTQYTIGGAD